MTDINETMKELAVSFEEFKSANDARLKEVEQKGKADPLTEDKVNRINDHISEVEAKMKKIEASLNRPAKGAEQEEAKNEYKENFEAYVRKGKEFDVKATALTSGVDADGGYAAPQEVDRNVYDMLLENSPMRTVANVMRVSSGDFKKVVNVHGATAAWAAETGARTLQTVQSLAQVAFAPAELYTILSASQVLLEDAFFDVEAWIASEAAARFALTENAGFVSGTGTDQPKGITSYTTAATADASRAFGTLEHVVTGVAADLPATDTAIADLLINTAYKLKAGHRAGAVWMMNKATLASVRKIKDSNNNYLWNPGLNGSTSSTLLGSLVVENEDMASVGANNLPIAYGNFKNGYQIVDRVGTTILRDPYSNKPYVDFYVRKRVDGRVIDSDAIKFIKCSV